MSLNDVVCAVIERETGEGVTSQTPLDGLRGDSSDFINLLFEIENATERHISNDAIGNLKTVGDIVEALC